MRLAEYLRREKLSDTEFAERIGSHCKPGAIQRLRLRYVHPTIKRMYEIEVATQGLVSRASDWNYKPRRRLYRQRAAEAARAPGGRSGEDERVSMN